MDVPDLVRARLGEETLTAGVPIGDEDAVCLTPTRTLVYRSDGILSDEHVEEFPHDVERLSVKEGRRKTKFVMEYVEGTETFSVPSNRGDTVLELLLQGVLRHDGIIGRRESIAGVYRFTELTLVITDDRVLKHIGNLVWDDDFEDYPFDRVTGVAFERASNATSIAIEVDGRPQRVKVPNDTAPLVQQTLENALFEYYGVGSLEALNATIGEDSGADADAAEGGDIGFDADIDPLVAAPDEDGPEEGGATGSGDDRAPDPDPDPDPDAGRDEGGAVPDRMDVSIDAAFEDGRPESESESGAGPGSESESESGAAIGDRSGGASAHRPEQTDDPTAGGAPAPPDADEANGSETRHPGAGDNPGSERPPSSSSSSSPSSPPATDTDTGADERDRGERASASEQPREGGTDADTTTGTEATSAAEGRAGGVPSGYEPASREDLEAVTEQVAELTETVERQNELLKRQHKAIKQLVAELRSE